MKAKYSVLFLLIGLLSVAPSKAQENDYWSQVKRDTASEIHIRTIDQEELNAFIEDENFNYLSTPKDQETLWDKLKRWFYRHFINPLVSGNSGNFLDGLLLFIAVAGVAIMFYFIFKGKNKSALAGRDVAWGDVYANPTQQTESHFQDLIKNSEQKNDYKSALKYLYLWSIKRLDQANYIHYRPEYTNRQVAQKLSDPEVKNIFKQVSFYFEFVWYGHFDIAIEDYQKIKSALMQSKLAQ